MNKLFFLFCSLFFVSCGFLFAQEIDPFDELFENAAEDIIVEEEPVPVVEKVIVTTETSTPQIIQFTGSFSANIGIGAIVQIDDVDFSKFKFAIPTEDQFVKIADKGAGGIVQFSNTFYMTARPASDFTLHASLYTDQSNLFLNLSTFYFDYLWKNFFISAGKKSLSWGNIRLFSSDTYGPVETSVISNFNNVTGEVRFPFFGNWTLAGSGNASADSIDFKNLKYAAAYDSVLLNTNILLCGMYTFGNEAASLELKRTIAGYDVYTQALGRFSGTDFTKGVVTAGFYRLWETEGPDYGINAEYQYVHAENAAVEDTHKIALETGIKQMGEKKNLKLGTQWYHNITECSGYARVAFLVGGIFPHANWTNAVILNYDKNFTHPEIQIGSVVSISISY